MATRQNASTGEIVEDKSISEKKSDNKKPDDVLHVKVWSPFTVYFDDNATSISGENGTGSFDILPRHHNFITLLKPGELALQTSADELTKIKISGGVMHVNANNVTVFLKA